MGPTAADAFTLVFGEQAQSGVAESDERAAGFFGQAILQIGKEWRGGKERAGKFEKGWALDGLDGRPEMAVRIMKITEPATARPWLELHGKRRAFGSFVVGAELIEYGVKSPFQ